MTLDFVLTFAGGAAILIAAVALMFWQILSEPDRPNYPTSGRIKRWFMFAYMVFLYARGLEIMGGLGDVEPIYMTPLEIAASYMQCALFIVFLVDHCRNWLPAHTHARIRRLLAIARCRPDPALKAARTSAMVNSTGASCPSADVVGPALVALAMSGATVAGPNDDPSVLVSDH